jgi:arginine decarboxylase
MITISITTGIGEGPTPLAAFDSALLDAGVANYNLIPLSSVIPPGSSIQRGRYVPPRNEYGDRLYLVMARQEAHIPGETAVAGLGWTQEPITDCGLFVEITGSQRSQVNEDIHATLACMIQGRPLRYGPIQTELAEVECRNNPVCALAVAIYQSQPW